MREKPGRADAPAKAWWRELTVVACALLVSVVLLVILHAAGDPGWVRRVLPPVPGSATAIWQVQTTFLSVGFAGLTIAAQLFAEAPLAIGTSRKRVLSYIGASWFVTVGLAGNAVMGLASIRPPGHWQRELATALEQRGERVVYPQLPDAAQPRLEAWRAAADAALREAAEGGAQVTVIAHSLGAALWLGARPADSVVESSVDRVLLAAPPSPSFPRENPEVAEFAEPTLSRPAADTLIVASDADPCNPEGAEAVHGRPLGIPVVTILGGGHLTPASGYGEWPSMLEWCLDPSAVIRPR